MLTLPAVPVTPVVQVDFDGQYPVEGGKEVGVLLTRYASRALRDWEAAQRARQDAAGRRKSKAHGGKDKGQQQQEQQGEPRQPPEPLPSGRLVVRTERGGGAGLVVEPVAALTASS